jgi:heptosyltransferase-1
LFFLVEQTRIVVIACLHGRRNPKHWQMRGSNRVGGAQSMQSRCAAGDSRSALLIDYSLPRGTNNILVVRLGAMGDIIHALPAVASLKRRFPGAHITWVAESPWVPLLEGNGLVDRIVPFYRRLPGTWGQTRKELRERRYDLAIDFQGLIKSALIAHFANPERLVGFRPGIVRERPASWFYSARVDSRSVHVVDQALDLAASAGAASALAVPPVLTFPLPAGRPEGVLPAEPFVLTCPLAGWISKQWPLEHYEALSRMIRERLGMPLVLNGPPGSLASLLPASDSVWALRHESGIPGLIDATRRAALVIGVDSGPLHLAAALNKSGVAIFGPTDPARNGPRGGDFQIFRASGAPTTHRRGATIDPSMRSIAPEEVFAALAARVGCHA